MPGLVCIGRCLQRPCKPQERGLYQRGLYRRVLYPCGLYQQSLVMTQAALKPFGQSRDSFEGWLLDETSQLSRLRLGGPGQGRYSGSLSRAVGPVKLSYQGGSYSRHGSQ